MRSFRRLAAFISIPVLALLAAAPAGCGRAPAPALPAARPSSAPAHTRAALAARTPRVPPFELQAFAFRSRADGYGLLLPSRAGHCQVYAGRTTDGGARFGRLTRLAAPRCGARPPVTKVAVDPAGDGFAYGPGLIITHDGGRTWTPSRQRGTVLAVAAAGRTTWMLLARCPRALRSRAGPACPLRVLTSRDGGRSWRDTAAQPSGTSAVGAASSPQFQAALIATGPASAYVAGAPDFSRRGRPGSAPLWRTRDSGASWTRTRVPCNRASLSLALSAAPGGSLLAVCGSEMSAGSQLKSVLRSADGGRSWTVALRCPALRQCRDGVLASGYLGELDAVSARTGYLVGARSPLLVTRDGGARWTAVRPLKGDTSGGSEQVQFLGQDTGIVLALDSSSNEIPTLWRTRDGGRHWLRLVPATPR